VSFDFGEVLSRAWQITWKHKVLWLFSALPVFLAFLIFPIMIVPVFFFGMDSQGNPVLFENPIFIILFVAFNIVISTLSFVLYTIGTSCTTLGVLRVEQGVEHLTIPGLFNEGMKYFARILGVGLLVTAGVSAVFSAFFVCMALFGMVTMGLGFICAQPLIILLYPVMMVLYAFIEQAQAAVVSDDMGVTQAIARGWNLVKSNFWRVLLISLIVYLGIGFLSGIVMMPFMVPFFFLPFLMEDQNVEFNMRSLGLMMVAFSVIFLPALALLQGITITFLKSTYTLVYLRLTRNKEITNTPVAVNA
jgi:uncharacterized membrane protein